MEPIVHAAPAFERDAYLTQLDTEVVTAGGEDDRPWAVLADTVLYPEGGGQPADRGWLGEVEVIDVRRRAGAIHHLLAAPVAPGPVTVRLDWSRRFDHMQQHSAQHLVTAIALDRFGWRTTAFHLSTELSDIELDVPHLDAEALLALEEAVAAAVRAARPITARRVSQAEMAELPVRSRGLPEGHEGDVRLVEIEGIDCNTCGGTHVRSTAELEAVKLLHTEPMRGGTRLYFVAGGRLRRRLAADEERAAALRAVMDTGDDELVAVASLRARQLKALQRSLRHTSAELAELWAATLASRPGALVDQRFEERDMAFLLAVARAALQRSPSRVVLLTAAAESGGLFVVAAGDDVVVDVPALGRQVAEILHGRGGGRDRVFQGKADAPQRHDEAAALLRTTILQPRQ